MKSTQVYLPAEHQAQLRELAKRTGTPMSVMIRWGITRAIEYYTEVLQVMGQNGIKLHEEAENDNYGTGTDDTVLSVGE